MMDAPLDPRFDTPTGPDASAALRQVFQQADRATRPVLRPALPPQVVEFAGIKMYVDPRDNYTDLRIWLDGHPPEIKSLAALMDRIEGRNAFVLDIGANCGAYTVPLAAAVGPASRVIAFEPNPVMIGRLGHNVRLNGLGDVVRIEGCALGAEAGEAVLNFRYDNFGQASLKPIPERQRDGGTLVPVRPLLDFVHQAKAHDISALKIDVEGAEELALGPLLDAGGWLPDVMLMETRHADEWDRDVIAQITGLGYTAALETEGNTLFVRQDAAD